jgi:hypothetical protein
MDERIQAFLKDVLALEGDDPSVIREGVRAYLAAYEKLFRDAETKRRMKDQAAHAAHVLCRARVVEEKQRRKGTSTTEHLKLVLIVIDGSAKQRQVTGGNDGSDRKCS